MGVAGGCEATPQRGSPPVVAYSRWATVRWTSSPTAFWLEAIEYSLGVSGRSASTSAWGDQLAGYACNTSMTCRVSSQRPNPAALACARRSEEHTSELQSLMRLSYAVFCLKKKIYRTQT